MPDLTGIRSSPLDRFGYAPQPRSKVVELSAQPSGARLVFRARSEAAIARIGEAFGLALPREACRFAGADGRVALWLGPDEWMLVQSESTGEALFAELEPTLVGHAHALVDVSDRSIGIAVTGPGAAVAINAGCPLDLGLAGFPVGMCTRTVLGKAEIVLVRTAADRFTIDVWRSFAPYVWQFLDEARREST